MDFIGKLAELQRAIDDATRDVDVLRRASAATGLRHAHIVLAGGAFAFLFVFVGFGASFFSHLIGFLYPAFASFKAIESPSARDDRQWLMYWVVFACFAIIESFSDQLYYSAKICFLLFCQLPQFQGATFIYEQFARPLFLRNAPAIERQAAHFRNVSDTIMRMSTSPVEPTAPPAEPPLSHSQLFGESAPAADAGGKKSS